MKKLLTIVLAAALCTPVFAQTGSNRNAPTLKQSITTNGATISLDYTSINWASGKTVNAAMDKEKGAETRTRINNNATTSPIGTLTTSIALTCGDLNLAAGEYRVYFTINDACEWQVNFQGKEKTETMTLNLNDTPEESKRLLLCLYAGENNGAGVYISFGKKMGFLAFEPAKVEKKS